METIIILDLETFNLIEELVKMINIKNSKTSKKVE